MKFDPSDWLRQEVTTDFPVFPGRVLGFSYTPLKFSKEKKLVMATPPKLFDGIP